MKVRIIENGVTGTDGMEITKGTVMNVPGDEIPAWLVNKAVKHDENSTGGQIITGQEGAGRPKTKRELLEHCEANKIAVDKNATVAQINETIAAHEFKERSEFATILGITVEPSWTREQLDAAILAAEGPQQP